ncbi:AAA family ATPase [Streptomyces sp. G5(2025)]|uniref:AAA family ATPase n=1 Tax=Streptomyces sp. G5(2025) TaxID=3406628 RepID=UPI003C160AD5
MTDTVFPSPVLIVLLGASGSGKSTTAASWPPESVLELDTFLELIADEVPAPEATEEAVHALGSVVERRLARRLTTVVDADHTEAAVRSRLLTLAERYDVPAVALVMTTPLQLCLDRNARRPAHLRLPKDVVRAQHARALDATPTLRAEGFDHIEALFGGKR